MSRQDKATSERFTRTLRELVKRPENKVCADCKRNDPRWASWNIGVFLCIRCSGIHRGMGTHISKVKSVDLDVWTPEQMESIQKWGNHYANLYWEAHLKAGHVPPEHKMESFIRSKYESRRWALDGPPPVDPQFSTTPPPPLPKPPQPHVTHRLLVRPTHNHTNSFSTRAPPAVPATTRQPQAHQLLSSNYVNRPTGAVPAPTAQQVPTPATQQQQQPKAPENDLFSLDFHGPPVSNTPEPKKDRVSVNTTTKLRIGVAPSQQQQQPPPVQQQPTSMVGNNGVGMWGASSGWSGAPAIPAQPNVWGAPAAPTVPQQQMFNTNAVWGSAPAAPAVPTATTDPFGSFAMPSQPAAPKKDDVFGDIWGGFK
ncbi:hypothetical protein BJ912DRAFT_1052882 [Pholiota molesta]|nr:hypothetical protein BJ912DRAFT_1052882 [Pholiota molesta]